MCSTMGTTGTTGTTEGPVASHIVTRISSSFVSCRPVLVFLHASEGYDALHVSKFGSGKGNRHRHLALQRSETACTRYLRVTMYCMLDPGRRIANQHPRFLFFANQCFAPAHPAPDKHQQLKNRRYNLMPVHFAPFLSAAS